MTPLFVSFYTPDYEAVAGRLVDSLKRFSLPHHVQRVEHKGNWQANCCAKPEFIREMMKSTERGVVWIDADAEVVAYPSELTQRAEADVYAWFAPNVFPRTTDRPWGKWGGPEALLSGTLRFKDSIRANILVLHWIEQCSQHPSRWDQQSLQAAMPMVPGLTVGRLPQSYCKVFDRPYRPGQSGPDVIVHYQESRKARRRR